MRIDTAMRIAETMYRKFKNDPYTKDPVARAMYEAWKQADKDFKTKQGERNNDNLQR